MGLFDKFPYTDYHQLNLDWIIKKIKTVDARMDSIDASADAAEEAKTEAQAAAVAANASAVSAQEAAERLANGSPVVVTLAEDMTDTDIVYLYMGTETGYVAGNWYYYDGSEWLSGGAYGGLLNGSVTGKKLSTGIRSSLKEIFRHIAFKDSGGATAYNNLVLALDGDAVVTGIHASYNQGTTVVYDTDLLSVLYSGITVYADYSDGSSDEIPAGNCELSGELNPGTSVITITYVGYSATFNVTVTEKVNFTPTVYAIGSFDTTDGVAYASTQKNRIVPNPIAITGLKNGATYKISLNGLTSITYACGRYEFSETDARTIDFTFTEGTNKQFTTDAVAWNSLGHNAWSSDDCIFTWLGDNRSMILINFRNSGNTNVTAADVTAVRDNLTITKETE